MRKVFRIYELDYIHEVYESNWCKNARFKVYDNEDYETEDAAIELLSLRKWSGRFVILPVYIIK